MSRNPETANYKLNHVMFRIKDPKVSLHFYQEILGMELYHKLDYGDHTHYFLAYNHEQREMSMEEKLMSAFGREGFLELAHKRGTESDPNFKGYTSGNTEPGLGFGHIALLVGDAQKACERLERYNVPFVEKLTDGIMKNIAFIKDPDGYWVEIVGNP